MIDERPHTKYDLQIGMLVILKKCQPRLVMPSSINSNHGGELILISEDEYVECLDNYTEDLKCIPCDGRDIIAIYAIPECSSDVLSFLPSNRKLLWERKEVVEYSKKDAEALISKMLGVPLSEVRVV